MQKHLTTLYAVGFLLLLALSLPTLADSNEENLTPVELTLATNITADSQKARRDGRVILLLVSQEECPFCMLIKQEILGPMIKNGDYAQQLLIRELMIDQGSEVLDFKGNIKSGSDLALQYGVGLTPTLLFLDADGKELTKRMIGIQTPEMFYYYVDESVQKAITLLKQNARI